MRIAWVWSETLSLDFWINRKDSFSYVISRLAENDEVYVLSRGGGTAFEHKKARYILSNNIVDILIKINPDVIITMGFHNQYFENIKPFKGRKIVQDAGGNLFSKDCSGYDAVVVTRKYQAGYVKGKAVVIPCGADIDLFRPSDIEKKWDVCCIANDFPVKRIPLLILAQKQVGFKLAIIGKGHQPYGNKIDSIGYVSNENLPMYLNQSKIYCMVSSSSDTGPRALGEALACGLPIITLNDSLGISSLVQEADCGIISPLNDFCGSISKLLSNETLRQEYGKKARDYAEKHLSFETVYQQWRDLIYGK